MNDNNNDRRPLKTRSQAWAKSVAGFFVKADISPNTISILSIVPALAGAWILTCRTCLPSAWPLVLVAICIQMRLLFNMLDGMVAIEGGKQSSVGILYNEIPDRIADSLFIVALGYAINMPWLGWLGALLAALTAYIRVLGGAIGLALDFRGPLAKPHRMFVMTLGCLIAALILFLTHDNEATMLALTVTAYIIAIGSALTCIARTLAIAKQLKSK
jgi:phosphatidylglycerophosphate synthase